MMPRPMLLVLLVVVLIITSQFEWKQQLVVDVDSNSNISRKQQRVSKGLETVKEKKYLVYHHWRQFYFCVPAENCLTAGIVIHVIILMQEQNIRRLNELVRHLQEQLQQCRSSNGTRNGAASHLAQQILDLSDIKF